MVLLPIEPTGTSFSVAFHGWIMVWDVGRKFIWYIDIYRE